MLHRSQKPLGCCRDTVYSRGNAASNGPTARMNAYGPLVDGIWQRESEALRDDPSRCQPVQHKSPHASTPGFHGEKRVTNVRFFKFTWRYLYNGTNIKLYLTVSADLKYQIPSNSVIICGHKTRRQTKPPLVLYFMRFIHRRHKKNLPVGRSLDNVRALPTHRLKQISPYQSNAQ